MRWCGVNTTRHPAVVRHDGAHASLHLPTWRAEVRAFPGQRFGGSTCVGVTYYA